MSCKEVRTQAELDAALTAEECPHLVGDGYFVVRGSATVRASGSATVEASGSATVRAWGSATVRAWGSATVEAWGSATVEAWGSATVRAWGSATVEASGSATVEASGSATVRASGSATVEASGSATVRASDSATVRAWGGVLARLLGDASLTTKSAFVHTTIHGKRAKAIGGTVTAVPDLSKVENWLEWYGIEISKLKNRRVVWLYKAVSDDWKSGYGFNYGPGSTPEAPDWDGGANCCGGGLHFCPTTFLARSYHRDATKFVKCPVEVSGLTPIVEWDGTSDKCKARRVIAPGCVEVDEDGEDL